MIITFLIAIILGSQISSNYELYKAEYSNKTNHMLYGNISKNGSYKCLHINNGNSSFSNKIDNIYSILDIHKPDIVSIQEANYDINNPIQIRGYNIEY